MEERKNTKLTELLGFKPFSLVTKKGRFRRLSALLYRFKISGRRLSRQIINPGSTVNKQLFYGYYTGQLALAGTPSYDLQDFVGASFTAHMSLPMPTSAFKLEVRFSTPTRT